MRSLEYFDPTIDHHEVIEIVPVVAEVHTPSYTLGDLSQLGQLSLAQEMVEPLLQTHPHHHQPPPQPQLLVVVLTLPKYERWSVLNVHILCESNIHVVSGVFVVHTFQSSDL
ncbi:MAG: hypothetical protein WCI00_06740 [bacterium]